MSTRISEDLEHEFTGTIGDLGLARKADIRRDEDPEADDATNPIQVPLQMSIKHRQGVDSALTSRGDGLLG